MKRYFFSPSTFLILFCLTISGCSSTKQSPSIALTIKSSSERAEQLANITQWQVTGKIAFIEKNKRESASLNWQVDEKHKNQQLNLTSYLGINVLQLKSTEGQHSLKFDGKTYQDDDLTTLIYSLTGLTLPTEALVYWIKGVAFQPSDHINYDQSNLPIMLTSVYNNQQWQVTYGNYKQVNHYVLPTKLTIKKDNLLIKIAIKQWLNVK